MHRPATRDPRVFALASCAILGAALSCATATPPPAAPPAEAKPTAHAEPPAPPPLPAPVKGASIEGITEYRLDNGLRVLLYPDGSKPTMVVNITYVVGSRNESYGETGMAHLLEHLLFKGTDLNPDVPKVLTSLGARFNGSTNYDRTNYFVMFPASTENLSTALGLEADRMIHSHIWKKDLWDEETKKGEMTVVRNEMERDETDPIGVTDERVASVAYDWHNYGKSTIGARSDVENVNIEHLQAFYHRYYQPDNAVLMVAGKIDTDKVLAEINEKFGRIPRPERKLEKEWTVEPTQDGERSVSVRRVGGTPFLAIGYHTPQGANADADALNLIAQILEEAPSGRLYKALVETRLAARITTNNDPTFDPGLFLINIELPKDGNLAAAREAALGVLESFAKKPITKEELERARAALMKNYDMLAKRTDFFAIAVSEAIASGDWRLYFIARDNVEHMTLAQAQAAADHYFRQSNRTVGEYVPTEKPERAEMPAPVDIAAEVKDYKGHAAVAEGEVFDTSPANIEARTVRFTAKNGMKGALLAKKTKGSSVTVALSFHLGTEQTLMNQEAVPQLTGQMLMRGTTQHTRQQLKDAFDQLKAQVNVGAGPADTVRAAITTDREHLAATLALLAEVLKSPSFPADELATLRAEQITNIEEQRSEPQAIAFVGMQLALNPYPKGHPLAALSIDQTVEQLKAAKLEKLKAFHREFYGANHGDVAVVGDFDAKEVQAQLEKLFGEWNSAKPYVRIAARMKEQKGLENKIETPDKANAMFIAAEDIPLKDSDADYPAFVIANEILGGNGLKSRLGDRIRRNEGISYTAVSAIQPSSLDPVTLWLAFAIYAPENLGRLEKAFAEEMERAQKGFTAEELAFSKNSWLQGRQVSRAQDGGLARRLADYLFYQRTMEFDAALEAKMAALTVEQVNATYNKLLDPSKLVYIKAGDFNKKPAAAPAAPAAPAK